MPVFICNNVLKQLFSLLKYILVANIVKTVQTKLTKKPNLESQTTCSWHLRWEMGSIAVATAALRLWPHYAYALKYWIFIVATRTISWSSLINSPFASIQSPPLMASTTAAIRFQNNYSKLVLFVSSRCRAYYNIICNFYNKVICT